MSAMTESEIGFAVLLKNRKTLKQFRDEVLARTVKTGHYNGLKRLTLRETDPISFDKLYSKLYDGLLRARVIATNVAARQIDSQQCDPCFTLYNAIGDCMLTSTGSIIHASSMGAAIKSIIENSRETDPGINPDDIFTYNIGAVGSAYPCHVATIVPIFWESRVIGWLGGVTQMTGAESATPSSTLPAYASWCSRGDTFAFCKGVKNRPLHDWQQRSLHSTPATTYWMLDERPRITDCQMIRELIEEVIADEGIENFEHFAFEVIEECRRGLQSRIEVMALPGTYCKASLADVPYVHAKV